MKRLGIFRHAKSDWDDMSLRDFDRGLNERGQRGAALMGAHIAEHGGDWKSVVASPAERVKRTLEFSRLDLPVRFEETAYLADASTLIRLLQACNDSEDAVLMAGHNPGMQELALDLVASGKEDTHFKDVMRKFPTAAFAVLELDIDSWADLESGCGAIVHFARPRDLDPDLGPLNL
ncbi:SixA phosphatase family protein [Aurantiacibacter gangjinensis]|uniref:Phosphohistidine phosphatase n=1 Tax=Aurantiacibacter gangjinensis TaxID=502682 RepID=A0A0G9MR35_9SPHN|nr:histidine phosphatase family protein [Aurantiacibacter gangjinensis]APE29104.1 Phosphohistidine phosphatase SixA [Aurantiacibacter gangjinensis]KLE33191.1 phosphohistidine phosphatase [Aurantiacibacter gangjinensis]